MNIFNKVTLQSLKKNKARTLVTIIGIMLSTALICAVMTSFSSVSSVILSEKSPSGFGGTLAALLLVAAGIIVVNMQGGKANTNNI